MAHAGLAEMSEGAPTTQSASHRHTALTHIRGPGVHIGAGGKAWVGEGGSGVVTEGVMGKEGNGQGKGGGG